MSRIIREGITAISRKIGSPKKKDSIDRFADVLQAWAIRSNPSWHRTALSMIEAIERRLSV